MRQTWRVAAWTDADGRFTIARDCWDFGRGIDGIGEDGEPTGRYEFTWRLRLWFYPADRAYGFAGDWGTFDPDRGVNFPVTMQPEPEPAR